MTAHRADPAACTPRRTRVTRGGAAGAPVSLDAVRPLLRGLDREQRRAVTHGEGALLVVAGPGTGKTEVITRRAAWLIATKRAQPSQVLALTYTDKAAEEMQARVDLLVPYGRADAAVHTFHAFGDRLIREFGHELGMEPSPRVISRPEAVALLREHLFDLGLDRYRPLADPTRFLHSLVDMFHRAKDEGVNPEELGVYAAELAAGARAVAEVASADGEREVALGLADEAAGQAELAIAYAGYQRILAERGLLDFGDQVSGALRLLRERPSVRAEVCRRYRYLLVDEFQDTNPAQLALVRELASHGNVTVVGDDDQAIYAFRGAAVENLLGLGEAFPSLRRIVLRRNYRSQRPILAAAQRLIRHNDPGGAQLPDDLDRELIARRRARRPLPVREAGYPTVADEAGAVGGEIARRVALGARPRDFAILVRANGDAEPFLEALTLRGVAWRFSGAAGLLAHPEVRELLALMHVVVEPDASTDLYAVATGEPYRLGGEDLTSILEMTRRRHRSLWAVLSELVDQPGLLRLSPPTREGLTRLVDELRTAMRESHELPAPEVLYSHLRRSGRYASLVAAAEIGDDGPLRRVARLFELVRDQATLLDDGRLPVVVPPLRALLESGADPAADDGDPYEDAVSVLTVHKAKGLEFPVVFLVGLVEGRFPARGRRERLVLPEPLRRRPGTDAAPWAEERRLCFVAMTRARDELILTHAAQGVAGGRRRRPSPFIAEALDRVASVPIHADRRGIARLVEAERLALVAADGAPVPRDPGRQDGPLTLSHSQVDDYLTCPLKYRLRHLLRVPTPPHHALVLGNALHQAVAAHHLGQLRGRPLDEAAVLEVFAAHWSSEGFISREHEEARYAAGRETLRRFLAAPATETGRVTTAVERPFSVRFGRDTVRGRYDRLDAAPAGVIITDYKSSDVRDPNKAHERARDSLQLQLYALAHEAETGQLPVAMELHFLESGLVGRVQPDRVRLDRARATLEGAADGIRGGRFDARPDYLSCSYCPYREICPSAAG